MEEASSLDQVRHLADQLYDGNIDDQGMLQIESLILSDPRCLQAYVERMDFHSELLEQADERSAESAALDLLQQSAQVTARRESRLQWRGYTAIAVTAVLLLLGMKWIHDSEILVPAALGTVANISTDYEASGAPLELGQVVRVGQKISVRSGVLSLQLSGAFVDVVGPAQIRLSRHHLISLFHGTVLSKVQPAAIGFTVRTREAEVVDLGTEFLVSHTPDSGSYVSVRQGVAQAKLIDWRGASTKEIELTSSRAALFHTADSLAREVAYSTERYQPVDRSRRGIRRITGAIRTSEAAETLRSNEQTTPNHMLVIPEQQVVLAADLKVESLTGPVTIRKGTKVSSYLMHYDPTASVSFAPRGAVTFFGEIVALVGSAKGLQATDRQFGLSEMHYEEGEFRQLELDEDEIRISDDRKTISFFFGVSPPAFLDEVRILVVDSAP